MTHRLRASISSAAFYLLATGCSTPGTPEPVTLDDVLAGKPEVDRLRFFHEIRAHDALKKERLTGQGVRVTIMGETIDPLHPDLSAAVDRQFDAFTETGEVLAGERNLPWGDDALGPGEGHGTHIAGTLAAACDGAGIQGIACNARLDAYDLGFDSEDESEEALVTAMAGMFTAFATALDDVTARGESRITTGSFNMESPAIRWREDSAYAGRSAVEIARQTVRELDGPEELFERRLAVPLDPEDERFLERVIEANGGDDLIALQAVMPLSSEWRALEDVIADYQATDAVYLITESNDTFENRTSTLNAMPSLSDEVDPDLWLSVVMVTPENMEENAAGRSGDEFTDWVLNEATYSAPINSCGSLAADYCIVTPSYRVLSTMTKRVATPGEPLFELDERFYQVYSGHSMGAPMVAATLALMEEENRRKGHGYSMKALVRLLEASADRDFRGYDRTRHGVGMLDVGAAIDAMSRKPGR